jgi:hypothetical protein
LLFIPFALTLVHCGDDTTAPAFDAGTDAAAEADTTPADTTTSDVAADTAVPPTDTSTTDTVADANVPDAITPDATTTTDVIADSANTDTTPVDPEPVFTTIPILNSAFDALGDGVPADWNFGVFFGTATAVTTVFTLGDNDERVARLTINPGTYVRMRPASPSVDAIAAGELYRVRARVRLGGTPQDEWDEVENGPWVPPIEPTTVNVQLAGFGFSEGGDVTKAWEFAWSPPTRLTQRWQTLEATHLVTADEAGLQLYVRLTARHAGPGDAVVLVDEVTLERASNRPLPAPQLGVLNASFENPALPDGEFSYGFYGWHFPYPAPYAGIVRHGADILPTPPDGAQVLELGAPAVGYSTVIPFVADRFHTITASVARRPAFGNFGLDVRLALLTNANQNALGEAIVNNLGVMWTDLTINCFRPTADQIAEGPHLLLSTQGDGRAFIDHIRIETVSDGACTP